MPWTLPNPLPRRLAATTVAALAALPATLMAQSGSGSGVGGSGVGGKGLGGNGGPAGQPDAATQEQLGANLDLIAAVVDICYVLGAICAIIGAVVAYGKLLDGQPGGGFGLIRNWFFACLALLLLPALLRGVLGI